MATANDDYTKTESVKNGSCWINPWSGWKDIEFLKGAKWLLSTLWTHPMLGSVEELDSKLPVRKPEWSTSEQLENAKIGVRATWLGHASVLFQIDGAHILCDPIFSDRCSPNQYFGIKRYRPAPCQVADLPASLHAVCISHTHFDHMDYWTLRQLVSKYPTCHFFVPSGVAHWMQSNTAVDPSYVTEFVWWQEHVLKDICHRGQSLTVVFTPTQHWSQRNLFDRNHCLWGSWALIGPKHRAWFAGDTAYCEAFRQIGKHLGPFHLAAIPIGAYEPRSFMCNQHVNPAEAIQIHQDVRTKYSLGIHWGTFLMASEGYLDPILDLSKELKSAGISPNSFITVDHGSYVDVPFDTIHVENPET